MTVYVAGGGGTHLEPRIASHYLAALLAEGGARGVPGTVVGVKTQQSEVGAPLDDLVVEGRLPDGAGTRLDLQITTTLSFTAGDEKWADILRRAWTTFCELGFDRTTRRIGVAVSQTTTKLERSIQPLLARARHAADAVQYRARLDRENGANQEQRDFQKVLEKAIRALDLDADDDEILAFLRCLVILAFDVDQEESSRDRLAATDRLTPITGDPAKAAAMWSSLNALASRIIPSGGGVARADVVATLLGEGYVIGADRRHAELVSNIDAESRAALAGIRDTIGGVRISRDAAYAGVLDALSKSRFVRVVGEHGTGKSALLKRLALDEPAGVPALVLRDLRVAGGGWAANAARFGAAVPLATLLREMGLAGTRTLFIDGIDKILDPAVQVTINDVLLTLATTADLAGLRVVVTAREQNIERVDGWLEPAVATAMPGITVRVEGLDDDEAREAAAAMPTIRPLLMDPRGYDKVLRRPFFLEALSRLPTPGNGQVRSEIDLIELWWRHGAADAADFAPAQGRRNTLLTLGERLLASPGLALPIRDLDPVPVDELRRAGVLRDVDYGATVAFSHDIYEEWSLHRVLGGRRGEIAEALRDGGQDLQLIRPLQLVATGLLERDDGAADWSDLLRQLDGPDLRLACGRAVLTAPIRSVQSGAMLDRIEPELMARDGGLLSRLLLAVRTTETERDLQYLDETAIPGLSRDERERLASQAASPQPLTWMRLLDWLVPRLAAVPASQLGEVHALLAAWVRMVGGFPTARLHVPAIAAWARSRLGDADTIDARERGWGRNADPVHADEARTLIVQAAGAAPDVAREYLAELSARAVKRQRKKIVETSGTFVQALPDELAAFVRRAFFLDHDRQRRDRHSTMRERAETFGFDDDQAFYPGSPHRMPFLAMLRAHPGKGLALVRSVCNHAMEGWRRSRSGPGRTPIPLTVDLGAGPQPFWGDGSSYAWFRGTSHVHILDCVLMALELWALERLAAGDPLDDLCRRIAAGNECNAVLGICASLCLTDTDAAISSDVALALALEPAAWAWDISRQIGDHGRHVNEIGYWAGARFLAHALHAHNDRPHRQRTIRDLSIGFAVVAAQPFRDRYAAGVATFLDRVPFETAEQRDDPQEANAGRRYFDTFRQQADPANLKTEVRDGRTYRWIEPPYTAGEKHQRMLADNAALERVLRLKLWANAAVESGGAGDGLTLDEAFDEMVALYEDDLFDEGIGPADMRRHSAQSAVSAVAAAIARHACADLWARAAERVKDVARRAATMIEPEDELSSRGAHVSGHPPAMAAHAYSALVRREPDETEWRAGLFQLAVDPIEKVTEAVHEAAAIYADVDPDMTWRLFCLATQRAARIHEVSHALHWSTAEAAAQGALADEAEEQMLAGKAATPHPAPGGPGIRRRDTFHWDYQADAFRLPLSALVLPATRAALLDSAASSLDWALRTFARSEDRGGDVPHEWLLAFGAWLGRLLGHLDVAEVRALLIDRLNAADPDAAAEVMDVVMRNFMIDWLLKPAIKPRLVDVWDAVVDWVVARKVWSGTQAREALGQHNRGMALSTLFCAANDQLVCGVDRDWPHMPTMLPAIGRAVGAVGMHRTPFAGLLKLVAAQPDRLLPHPGLDWIAVIVRARRSDRAFWDHLDNGEQLVLVLRDLIAAGPLSDDDRALIVSIADALIEAGVRGAAFLHQDMVRRKR